MSPTKLYAFGLKTTYLENKNVVGVGKQLYENEKLTYVPIQTAAAIYDTGKMTKRIYTDIRLFFFVIIHF